VSYSKGRYAFGYCDRTGFRYPLSELVYEVQDGRRTGMRVGRDVLDPDHPQNHLGEVQTHDPRPLRGPRPDTTMDQSRGFFGWKPVGNPLNHLTGAVGTVTVTTE